MKITRVRLSNFRRLEDVDIDFEQDNTVLVGPNNSGKTSATTAFRLFLIRPDFRIYDLSVSRLAELDAFGATENPEATDLPSIDMDIWFSIDPDIEFGRVFSLIPNVSADLTEVGVRISFCVKDAEKLWSDYLESCPQTADGSTQKTLAQFLSARGNLNRHFGLNYFALEKTEDRLESTELEPEEGKRVLRSLVRVDFVDAQRNIDDQDSGRSNRLSAAFAAFYKKNLEQAEVSDAANQIIDENNANLTQHYEEHFKGLMGVIQNLGVPSVNDRGMKIVSSLDAETALKGSTDLFYVDDELNHELPESYNGLGFKNLVYMAIQISHFHLQWMATEEKRPLCQIIFVEEPEVHLHAQVQLTFISNIWSIIRKASEDRGEIHMVPQLGITTHSSHILDAVDFGKVRYFRRCPHGGQEPTKVKTLNASQVHNLREFRPAKKSASGEVEDEKETLDFLKQYLKLTHCDLFFADAAVLIEGTAEKLLLPIMIEKSAPALGQKYLTILEVGGAYASRFASLMEFLGIPYLVITDIDSVEPTNGRKACRADTKNAVTSNSSIKFYLGRESIDELKATKPEDHILADNMCFVAYQKPTAVAGFSASESMHGRTFEETFVYQNLQLFRGKEIEVGQEVPTGDEFEAVHSTIYERVKSSSFKKTEFALDVASSTAAWETPEYIADGLKWLEKRLDGNSDDDAS